MKTCVLLRNLPKFATREDVLRLISKSSPVLAIRNILHMGLPTFSHRMEQLQQTPATFMDFTLNDWLVQFDEAPERVSDFHKRLLYSNASLSSYSIEAFLVPVEAVSIFYNPIIHPLASQSLMISRVSCTVGVDFFRSTLFRDFSFINELEHGCPAIEPM